jgi:hypothetical protein
VDRQRCREIALLRNKFKILGTAERCLTRKSALPLELKDALFLLVFVDGKDLGQAFRADVDRETCWTALVLMKRVSGIPCRSQDKLTENRNGFKLPISIMSTSRSRPLAISLINLSFAEG